MTSPDARYWDVAKRCLRAWKATGRHLPQIFTVQHLPDRGLWVLRAVSGGCTVMRSVHDKHLLYIKDKALLFEDAAVMMSSIMATGGSVEIAVPHTVPRE